MSREDDINNLITGVNAIEPSSYRDLEYDNINYY
jgi:hypothetical protein